LREVLEGDGVIKKNFKKKKELNFEKKIELKKKRIEILKKMKIFFEKKSFESPKLHTPQGV